MTTTDAPVPVEQVDRDAVQAFHAIQMARIMRGDRTLGDDKGDAGVLVQAFARHRLAAQADLSRLTRERDEARAALRPFALHIQDHVPNDALIEHIAWTAGEHRRALAALGEDTTHD